jgi:protein phosphatase 2C family protein 2/3
MIDLASINNAVVFLDEEPNIDPLHVHQGYDNDKQVQYASYSVRGIRDTMEDEIVIECDMFSSTEENTSVSCFGVFDGHGGDTCSKYIAGNWTHFCEKTGKSFLQYDAHIEKLFLMIDEEFEKQQRRVYDKIVTEVDAGSTANVIFVTKNNIKREYEIACCNCGDSRAILCTGTKDRDVIPMSTDHKPKLKLEKQRIEATGGFIEYDRINGELAVSRCFGDFLYKQYKGGTNRRQQMVTPIPDIERHTIRMGSKQFQFVVIACDGVWDVMNNRQVAQFVNTRLKQQTDKSRVNLLSIARELCEHCAMDQNSTDNVSVIIILFN